MTDKARELATLVERYEGVVNRLRDGAAFKNIPEFEKVEVFISKGVSELDAGLLHYTDVLQQFIAYLENGERNMQALIAEGTEKSPLN